MSPKTFLAWLVVTACTLVAAVVVSLSGPETAKLKLDGEPVFPALREDPDAVTRVEIASAQGAFTLERVKDEAGRVRWTAPDASGYPVKAEAVRDLIVGLSDMRLTEAKTNREDRLDRLGLLDVKAEGSKAKQVVLLGGDKVIADILIGDSRGGYTGGQEGGTYIRRLNDPQAWLASGKVQVKTALKDWLDRDVVNLEGAAFRSAEIEPPATEPGAEENNRTVRLAREEKGAVFKLQDLPEGEEPDISEISRVVSGLAYVTFDEVAKAEAKPLPEESWKGRYVTFDGLEIMVETAKIGDQYWAAFDARALPEPEATEAESGADEPAEAEGEESAEARAAALRSRWQGWVYQLPDYAAERLVIGFDKLHKPAGEKSS